MLCWWRGVILVLLIIIAFVLKYNKICVWKYIEPDIIGIYIGASYAYTRPRTVRIYGASFFRLHLSWYDMRGLKAFERASYNWVCLGLTIRELVWLSKACTYPIRCLWSNLVTLPSQPTATYPHYLLPPPTVYALNHDQQKCRRGRTIRPSFN